MFLPLALMIGLTPQASPEFIRGVDASHVGLFEKAGLKYKEGGKEEDPFVIFKRNGINCIRLRLFTGTDQVAASDPYNKINNLSYTLPLAKRAKAAGMSLLLDFHYSDTWADPAHQTKPEAWKDLPFDQLVEKLKDYNREMVKVFREAGAMPEYIQVGNEITVGMLWPDGRVGGEHENPKQWQQFGTLMKAAIKGIQEGAGDQKPKLIVHIDRGADWGATEWYFDNLMKQDVPFDIIGQSYYPFFHGDLDKFESCLNQTAQKYGKPVLVAETGFPWNKKDKGGKPMSGIKLGPEGQVKFLQEVGRLLKALPDQKGAGVVYWGGEYLSTPLYDLGGFDGRSLFDKDGSAQPALKALGKLGS